MYPPPVRQAKAGLIWIIGQYAERIDNSQVLPPTCRGRVCRVAVCAVRLVRFRG